MNWELLEKVVLAILAIYLMMMTIAVLTISLKKGVFPLVASGMALILADFAMLLNLFHVLGRGRRK